MYKNMMYFILYYIDWNM